MIDKIPKISKKQAAAFAALIKNQVGEYCQRYPADYIEFLKSIADKDEEARHELEILTKEGGNYEGKSTNKQKKV